MDELMVLCAARVFTCGEGVEREGEVRGKDGEEVAFELVHGTQQRFAHCSH